VSAPPYTPAAVEGVAKALGGAGKAGGGWTCRCPAHDDRTASLSLSLGEGGRLLWHCHAGCDQAAVLAGLRTAGALLNGDARPAEPRRGAGTRARVVAAYPYVDEQGRPLFRVRRWKPKGFSQQRFEGGRWIGGPGAMDGVRRVLFRLPEVVAAEEVVFCEGEKDALNVTSAGFCGTTSPQGAKFWSDDLAAPLAGKRVVILPDNDEVGREHARTVAASVRNAGATSVKMVELPGLPEHGDVSDWLGAGHTADELRALVAKALEWEPGPRPRRPEAAEGPPVKTTNTAAQEGWQTQLALAIEEMNRRYFVARRAAAGSSAASSVTTSWTASGWCSTPAAGHPPTLQPPPQRRHGRREGPGDLEGPRHRLARAPGPRTYDRIALPAQGADAPGRVQPLARLRGGAGEGRLAPPREHLLDVVCDGNRTYYDYLVRWCATCVQHPERQAEVAVVLRGEKGTGKGTVGQVLARIFRDHALHVSNART
jgi:hypothetical protein